MTEDGEGPERDSIEYLLRDAARLELPDNFMQLLHGKIGQCIAEKYRINELLGRGGMGAVYRVTHVVTGRVAALKWLLPSCQELSARFVREAKASARIRHPNVVDVYDIERVHGEAYLVMELLDGQTLSWHIRRRKRTAEETVAIMLPVLRGVGAAHAAGVIHRDLKPDNIFLCDVPEGSPPAPKVLDFGICKILWEEDEPVTLTRKGSGIGTPYYMPREQWCNASGVDARTDIHALGVTMYQALTGQLPFQSRTFEDPRALAGQHPPPLRELEPSVPAALEAIVLRAMAPDAEDRHASAEALEEDLSRWQRGSTARTERRVRAAARKASWSALAGFAGAASVVALYALGVESERAPVLDAPPARSVAYAERDSAAAEPLLEERICQTPPAGDVPVSAHPEPPARAARTPRASGELRAAERRKAPAAEQPALTPALGPESTQIFAVAASEQPSPTPVAFSQPGRPPGAHSGPIREIDGH